LFLPIYVVHSFCFNRNDSWSKRRPYHLQESRSPPSNDSSIYSPTSSFYFCLLLPSHYPCPRSPQGPTPSPPSLAVAPTRCAVLNVVCAYFPVDLGGARTMRRRWISWPRKVRMEAVGDQSMRPGVSSQESERKALRRTWFRPMS
jgi:hypothetical protein